MKTTVSQLKKFINEQLGQTELGDVRDTCKTNLEDYESQGGRITKKVCFDVAKYYGEGALSSEQIRQLGLELFQLMTRNSNEG